jgi:Na+-driven multidrug efflux pump
LSILNLCWQIAIDKTALAFAYIQLQKMIGGLGKYAIASFSVIKDLERLAMLPAIAFATVLTFLVSNSLGAQDPEAARANIKKTLIMAAIFVSTLLIIMCLMPATFVTIFDQKNKFTDLAAKVFPFISLLVVFDFIQLLLAASLRGARDVGYVMLVRAGTCYLFFWPIGWWIAGAPMWPLDLLLPPLNITNETLKFILIYGFFYVNNGLMGLLFLARVKFKKQHPLRQATQA